MRLKETEMAECLNLPASTIKRWVRQGRIPVQKKGGVYLFEPSVLERWAGIHKLPLSLPQDEAGENRKQSEPHDAIPLDTLFRTIKRGGVVYDLPGEDVESLFEEAVERITELPDDLKSDLLERLIQREHLSSTGIGKGVAIPHPRNPTIDALDRPLITTCFLKDAINFHSVDNRPVDVLFILLSPTAKQHLHLLSRLSFCLRDDRFVDFLRQRPGPEALVARISEIESSLDTKNFQEAD